MDARPPTWRIDLLAQLRARTDDCEIVRFPTRKTGALLALLAFYPRPHLREDITGKLWPDAEPRAARNRLNQTLVWLRRRLNAACLPKTLFSDRQCVELDPAAFTTDVAEFEQSLRRARIASAPDQKIQELAKAVSLYEGELLPGCYEDWVFTERQRLQAEFMEALLLLARLYEQTGSFEPALQSLHRAVAVDPLSEEAHRRLIRLLARSGQPSAALRRFHELKSHLKRELDAQPSPATLALVQQIRERTAIALSGAHRPVFPPLPTSLTRFFGREAEIEHICEIVRNRGARIVTLIGMGGAGKTRLALEAGSRLRDAFQGAVTFVPLADVADADQIVPSIAGVLQLGQSVSISPMDRLVQALSGRECLLILDNLESLFPDALPLLHTLLTRLPQLCILVTSQHRIGIDGEHELPITPLDLPDRQATPEALLRTASAQLFADRAQMVQPRFEITPHNSHAVARICERLEGVPLAIELCAAWAKTLTPAQMLAKLDDRFQLLVSRRTDRPLRHRSIRAAVETSCHRLSRASFSFFAALSLFRGGWTLEAADAVCGEVGAASDVGTAGILAELAEHSLIVAEDASGEMRYRMLETLRDFGMESLKEPLRGQARRRHVRWFVDLAEKAEPLLQGPEQALWLERLERDNENLRSALTWAFEMEEIAAGLRLAGALCKYWHTRSYLREGQAWLERLLAAHRRCEETGTSEAIAGQAVLAKAWSALGYLIWYQGDYSAARRAHERALALRRAGSDQAGIAESLYHLGITCYRQSELPAARVFLEESLRISETLRDQAGISRALLNLGNLAQVEARSGEAQDFYMKSLRIEQALGNRQRTANALNNLGLGAAEGRNFAQAHRFFEEALALWKDVGDHCGMACALSNLGGIARRQKHFEDSETALKQALPLAHEAGDRYGLVHIVIEFAFLAAARDQPERCVFLFAAAATLSETNGGPFVLTGDEEYIAATGDVRAVLGEAVYEALWSEGREASLEYVVAVCLGVEDVNRAPVLSKAQTDLAASSGAAVPCAVCPFCGSERMARNGKDGNGKQKYVCRACGRSSRTDPGTRAYDVQFRARVLSAYRQHPSLRMVSRDFGISRQTLINWLKASEQADMPQATALAPK